MKSVIKSYSSFFALSLIIHLLLMNRLMGLPNKFSALFRQEKSESEKPIMKITVDRLGIHDAKNSTKNYLKYSESDSKMLSRLNPYTDKNIISPNNDLVFSDGKNKQFIPPKQIEEDISKNGDDKLAIKKVKTKEGFKIESYGRFQSQNQVELLSNSNLNYQFEVPKGVNLDQFNQFDQIFYSFAKRLNQTYQSAFYRQFFDFQLANPHFTQLFFSQKTSIIGKATFDKNGNLLKISSIQQSYNKLLDDVFTQTLEDVAMLPNIPEMVLNSKEQMDVKISLEIER